MKKIRIVHKTEYHYHEPVTFGQHRAMLRPREGHDLLIIKGSLVTEPESTIRWVWDFQGNSVAVINFLEPSSTLRVLSEVTVELHETNDIQCAITQEASSYPFVNPESESLEMAPFLIPSYPHDAKAIQAWLLAIYTPGEVVPTHELLDQLNTRIFESFKYERREEAGVQMPCETLSKGSGSCRDFAVFMMESARHWGFAARFVTGYIQMNEGQHGATHAWTEIYLPGEGWRGYDPTNNKPAGLEHVAVGVARVHEKAAPLSGAWTGAADAFDRMDVSVQVVEA
jgi:transglutaminase-like putative cysteine protease